MLRFVLFILWIFLLPQSARAEAPAWEMCAGQLAAHGPVLSDCRHLDGPVDPQGRQIWIRTVVADPPSPGGAVLRVVGVASSEAWLNDVRLGSNGTPGFGPGTEQPGRYEVAFSIPERAWQPTNNVVVMRLSSFHGGVRLAAPMGQIAIGALQPSQLSAPTALTLTLGGALIAAAFGFGVVHGLRRTVSSLLLAGMAGTAAAQVLSV
ncbi:MAG TPA: hypothetical protein PLQ03_11300 [Brevundimonas sp.]|uniref:hypothetical protein n=1 Tax=Brevundimonas sp. TaxID=1871086 RepID=UPI002610E15A|nr:hypothetical protein [Brevundimonas sp.]HRO33985.1 hypothetical protein [Brevundimonas sp.]